MQVTVAFVQAAPPGSQPRNRRVHKTSVSRRAGRTAPPLSTPARRSAARSAGRVAKCVAAGGSVGALSSEAELAREVASGAVVVLKLYTRSCRACIGVAPRFRKIAHAFSGRARFVEMEFAAGAQLGASLGVTALPYFAVYKGGRLVTGEPLAFSRIGRLADHVDAIADAH